MIGPIDPRAYDLEGRVTILPDKRSLHFRPTRAMGSSLSSPLSVQTRSIGQIRQFLRECRYVRDKEQFAQADDWMQPAEFERRKRGDCDDFALWAWRQVLALGYAARFVCGRAGLRGRWHAWVTFREGDNQYLLEPTSADSRTLPRLTVSSYEPKVSVAVESGKLVYREHAERDFRPGFLESLGMAAEWLPRALAAQARALLTFPFSFFKRSFGGRNA